MLVNVARRGTALSAEAVTPEYFKAAMASLAAPVGVLTCYDAKGEPCGLTVSALTSLSLEPPLLLVCLDRGSRSYGPIVAGRHFCINLLTEGQEWMARQFAGPSEGRFVGVDLVGDTVPGIAAAPVRVGCERYGVRDGGDHAILLGKVVSVSEGGEGLSSAALLWYRRRFATTAYT